MGALYLERLKFLLILFNLCNVLSDELLVEAPIGSIKGLSSDNGEFSMFMGIPYATVNASNPFGPSIPHPGFETTFEAFDDTGKCPQIDYFTNELTGNLDCLHLNVYVPKTASSTNRLPVMVWIFEGGFRRGFPGRYVYGPNFIVRHEVILVTINYRLGPYGFMCLDSPDIPGNQGLKDQLTALRWIKNNIEAFGGDTEKITLFGNSAGSASSEIHFLYTNENLFKNIILQSGAMFVNDVDPNIPLQIAEELGFETTDFKEAIKFLSTVDTNQVIAASQERGIQYGPCLEKEFENVERLITEHPLYAKSPNIETTSILLGFGSQEGLGVLPNMSSIPLPPSPPALPPIPLPPIDPFSTVLGQFFNFTDDLYLDKMAKNVRHFYIGDKDINLGTAVDLLDFVSDFGFAHPTLRQFQKYNADGVKTMYFYMFSYSGNRNFYKRRFGIIPGGAAHTDELGYLFDVSFFDETPTSNDQLIIDRITTLWTNFAKYGNPTPEITDLLPVQWQPITPQVYNYLNIDLQMDLLQSPHQKRMTYWDLFFRLNEKYQSGYREN